MVQWPHAPLHWSTDPGFYIVTAGTFGKEGHLSTATRRDFFQKAFFSLAVEFGWEIHAWAILENHYHWVGRSSNDSGLLRRFVGKLHMTTAKELNRLDNTGGRKVWFQYWDTRITSQVSYHARLNYVHFNPVKHGVVANAENYRWCSAAWFAENATVAFQSTVKSFPIDDLNVPDDF